METYKKLGGGDLDDARSLRSLSRSRFCGGLKLRLDWLGLDFLGERENRFDLRLFRVSGDLERDLDLDLVLLRLFDLLKENCGRIDARLTVMTDCCIHLPIASLV